MSHDGSVPLGVDLDDGWTLNLLLHSDHGSLSSLAFQIISKFGTCASSFFY